jgi:hypothetical protein
MGDTPEVRQWRLSYIRGGKERYRERRNNHKGDIRPQQATFLPSTARL